MSGGTQASPASPAGASGGGTPGGTAGGASAGAGARLSDEEILGITPVGVNARTVGVNARTVGIDAKTDGVDARTDDAAVEFDETVESVEAPHAAPLQPAASSDAVAMPQWMQSLAGDPQHSAEARQLWREHQEFRAAFSSPAEARTIKELFPGGAQEAQTLKQSAQSVERIDAAIFSGDARAQSEVVAELARANPAAFRSLFAEAAKVLGVGQRLSATSFSDGLPVPENATAARATNHPVDATLDTARVHGQTAPREGSGQGAGVPPFDPAAYASFERSTNDAVARDVRATIGDALSRVLPEGVAEGAARRIDDDIFNEVHRALAADGILSEQVGETLRGRQFGNAEQLRVTALLAGRARQLVPSVARRVIGEWTSSVLGTARTKAARQAAAASRVDIAAPGGSLDSMPLRALSAREVNYASMSADEILGL